MAKKKAIKKTAKKKVAESGFNLNGTVQMPKRPLHPTGVEDVATELLPNLNKFNEFQITINGELIDQIKKLQQRIDRIVDAINKSKSIKGL